MPGDGVSAQEGCLSRGCPSAWGCGCLPRGMYTSHLWTDRHLEKHNLSATTVFLCTKKSVFVRYRNDPFLSFFTIGLSL